MGKILTEAAKGRPLSSTWGCTGGSICFRCDSRLTGVVVYYKDNGKCRYFIQMNLKRNS